MLSPLLGTGAASVFLIYLRCTGMSRSVVGTLAGKMNMQDLVRFRMPLCPRRPETIVQPSLRRARCESHQGTAREALLAFTRNPELMGQR
ncbi:hypothetical protein E1N52_34790 [Paraburkholderia guartelaensis]|uniref:Uncharacterized protein n=2 Tax=Paraburkholderia guartelaensis TaxID=2546446 RepID=A0A4R5L583_9BURK|nr:hypothetical protein E1N52_34790 [Paraburkholderia guartelaensis]